MDSKTLSIFECKSGMRMAETIYNEFGAEIITKDTILDKQILDRIERLGILEVKVMSEGKEEIRENSARNIQSKYMQNTADMKDIMEKVRAGFTLDMTKVNEITDMISLGIYSNNRRKGPMTQCIDPSQYTYTHSINVSFLAMTLGRWMNCSEQTIKHLTQAGLLHDIGKCTIPEEIVNKPGELTEKEFDLMKQHPRYGYNILNEIDGIHNDVLLGILTHHEREDGTGYPIGVTSEKINLVGKILAIVDTYDAMTSERIYRKSQSPFVVFELMQNGSFGKLHPVILNKFIKNMSEHYHGAKVILNNGAQGEVVFINYNKVSKPIVNVGGSFIDLSLEPMLSIDRVIIKDMII